MSTREQSTDAAADASRSQQAAEGSVKVLVLQGGGALGAYQAGVYEALQSKFDDIHEVYGVSIGAINAAIIAGNKPEHRVSRLRQFWELVSSAPGQMMPSWSGDRVALNQLSASSAVLAGIPGFFKPNVNPALLLGGNAPVQSFYDTAPLKETLKQLVDFDIINSRQMRFAVGAVNVRTGESIYFDNHGNDKLKIGPEHIMASGALPPGFPAVEVGGEHYWDGGLVSNTPLQYVLDTHDRSRPLVVLQVDLFSAHGGLPSTIAEVMARQKDIQYASRMRLTTENSLSSLKLHKKITDLLLSLKGSARQKPEIAEIIAGLERKRIDIVQLIHEPLPHELNFKDYEFSRLTMVEHWKQGFDDMTATLTHPQWLARQPHFDGVYTYDLVRSPPGKTAV